MNFNIRVIHSRFPIIIGAALIAFLLNACDKQEPQPEAPSATVLKPVDKAFLDVWGSYHHAGSRLFADAALCVDEFNQTVQALLKSPNDDTLNNAEAQLTDCFELYLPTLPLVIHKPGTQKQMDTLRERIYSTPIFPGFIDAITLYPNSGIVNDPSLELTKANLEEQHGLTDPSDISLGFEVIAFLLIGEHRYDAEISRRSYTDFIATTELSDSEELPIDEQPTNRRRRMLELEGLILKQDLTELAAIWESAATSPRLSDDADTLLRKLLESSASLLNKNGDTTPNLETHMRKLFDNVAPSSTQSLANYFGWPTTGTVEPGTANTAENPTESDHKNAETATGQLLDLIEGYLQKASNGASL